MSNDMPEAEELRKIMNVMSETVPDLLTALTKVMYEAKAGQEFGKAVAAFYKTLVDSGMTKEQAFALTRDYMSNMNLGNIMKGVSERDGEK